MHAKHESSYYETFTFVVEQSAIFTFVVEQFVIIVFVVEQFVIITFIVKQSVILDDNKSKYFFCVIIKCLNWEETGIHIFVWLQ